MSDHTHCYTAACPSCNSVYAVTVADLNDTADMRWALKIVGQWERRGDVIGHCTVDDIRSGRVPLHMTDSQARKDCQRCGPTSNRKKGAKS